MTRPSAVLSLAAILLAGLAATSQAQAPRSDAYGIYSRSRTGVYDRPVISPYITLFDLESGALTREYYRRVRPELELRNAATRLSRSVGTLEQRVDRQQQQLMRAETSAIGPTGHTTWFLNHGKYYNAGRR